MTKLVCISDTHGFHHDVKLPDGDILIHAGDLSMMGELSVLMDLNDWFGKQEHNYKVVIAGNHDMSLGEDQMLGFKIFTNAIYLQNSGVELEGYKIYGNPYTPWSFGLHRRFAFGYDRLDSKGAFRGIPHNTDILVTHCPPKGIMDKVADTGFNPGELVGSEILWKKIMDIKPKVNIFGHIHEGYGVVEANEIIPTTFINCSVVNEAYNLVNKPIEFHL